MEHIKKYFNSKGMTLIEIMIAIAILGIILTTFAQVYSFVNKYDNQTIDLLKMAELAQDELENIKADGEVPVTPKTVGEYTLKSEVYSTADSGTGYKIIVALNGLPLDPADPDSYVLDGWVAPGVSPVIYIPPVVIDPDTPAPEQPYTPDNWVYDDSDPYQEADDIWNVQSNGISRVSTSLGHYDESFLFYNEPFYNFDFIAYPVFSKLSSDSPNGDKGTGISFKTVDGSVRYNYYMYNNNNKFTIRFDINGVKHSDFDIATDVNAIVGQKYYIRATHKDGKLTLDYGYFDANGDLIKPAMMPREYVDYLDVNEEYLIGLFDSSANDMNSTFQILSSEAGDDDCNMH